jgi:hypothetical protein
MAAIGSWTTALLSGFCPRTSSYKAQPDPRARAKTPLFSWTQLGLLGSCRTLRPNGIQEVEGSTPFSSILKSMAYEINHIWSLLLGNE